MTLEILDENTNTYVDITPYTAFGGLKLQRSDVDGPNAGRDLTGDLIRDRKAIKIRWDVTCKPLTDTQLATILTLIKPEWVTVRYTDPQTRTVTVSQMYANNFGMNLMMIKRNGEELWTGLAFPLIMK